MLTLFLPVLLLAQKNLVPVTQTNLLQFGMPAGTRQDKRFISVAAAQQFLSMSTEYKGTSFSAVEVYILPAPSSTGVGASQTMDILEKNGYQLFADNGDEKLVWAASNTTAYLVYFSEEPNQANMYVAQASEPPFELDYDASDNQVMDASSSIPASGPSASIQPVYIPPLYGRRSSEEISTSVQEATMYVYDLDSNRYSVIQIGDNFWMKENLRTTQYNDTTFIPTGASIDWPKTKNGAYSVYDDNPLNKKKYGLLYNGYAVASGKLCPAGWHVATDADWKALEKFYGIPESELERTGERGEIAAKLKTVDDWKPSSFSGDNSSGFSIQPGGARLDNGEYSTLNQYGNFWTSTIYDDRYGLLYLWNHHVHYNTDAVGRIYTVANNGYSCRCVKDKPKPDAKRTK